MKKTLAIVALLLVSSMAFAAKPLKVKSGSADVLKQEGVAVVKMDYSNATWEKKSSYEEFCGEEYEERVAQSLEAIVKGFNSSTKGLTFTQGQKEAEAQYTVTVKVQDMERKMTDIAMFNIRLSGTITIVDNTTGEEICEIEINKISGGSSYVPNTRLYSCFETLGTKLAKAKL